MKLDQRVTKIDYSEDKIKITHGSTVTEADHVLVTVPLGVLKNNVLHFVPSLPIAETTAMQKLHLNCNNKFLLVWPSNFSKFWGEE